jgi:hypothetical protein
MADGFVQLSKESLSTTEGIAQLNQMLQTLFDLTAGDGADQRIYSGYGVPAIAATPGSLFLRKDGAASTTLYVMVGTTWTAK